MSIKLVNSEDAVIAAGNAVAELYPSRVHSSESSKYETALNAIWSATNREAKPHCIFQPQSAAEVAAGLKAVVAANCPFSIKGGGHLHFKGACNIHGGFLFDLVHLDHLEVAPNRQAVRVGPGKYWGDVYSFLEKENLTVVGGRDASVGVPGFLLGGGISFLASQYGWGSDNIDSLEVVLADGTIVTANESKHRDLFRALRGGGPNFGIVTSFTLKAYPTSGLYGGFVFYPPDNLDRLLSLWVPFTEGLAAGTHPKGHIPISIAFTDEGVKIATALVYPEPVESHPPFGEFLRIADDHSNIGLTTQSALATALHEAVDYTGRRNSYWTLTTRVDEPIMRLTYDLWLEEAQKARQSAGIILDLELHPITSDQRRRAGKEGVGNAFGLEGSEEPLVIHLLAAAWDDSSYDQAVFHMQKRILDKVEAESKRRGIFHPFLYMNYASEFQDVIGSYGETSRRILEDVSKKYDPEGVFQKLQPGPFKLSGAPASVASLT